jgi:hypothetical protein
VTNRGFEYVTNWLAGNYNVTNWPLPVYIGWGTANGSNATSVVCPAGNNQWNDVGPYSELSEARVTGSASTVNTVVASSLGTYQLTGTITASAGESVGESFIAMSSTKPFATTLFTAITNSATSLTVSTTGAPSTPFYAQLNNEVLDVTAISSNTVYTVARAQNGSTAASAAATNTLTVGNPMGNANANPNHGDMFAHAGFVALSLNSGDSIAFTWSINVTY